jgi:hypothetical protein
MEEILTRTLNALKNILVPRFYVTERGFVNNFSHELELQIADLNLFPEHTIIEAEVQKRLNDHYGVRQRPDLLIHIPIETGLTHNANENNFVVYGFKLNGNNNFSMQDFAKLDEMFNALHYQIGIFININAYPNTFLQNYNGDFKDRIHEYSIGLINGEVKVIHSFFINGEINNVE